MIPAFEGNLIFQWPEIFKFKQWNWINFDFFHVWVEVCWYGGKSFECRIVILGLGFGMDWHSKASRAHMEELVKKFSEQMKNK